MLFDFVVLFGLGPQKDKPSLGVNLLHCYPAPTPGNEPSERAGDFCFPDLDNIQRSFQPPPQGSPNTSSSPATTPKTQILITVQSPPSQPQVSPLTDQLSEPQPQMPPAGDALLEPQPQTPSTGDILLEPQSNPVPNIPVEPQSQQPSFIDALLEPQQSSQAQAPPLVDSLVGSSTGDPLSEFLQPSSQSQLSPSVEDLSESQSQLSTSTLSISDQLQSSSQSQTSLATDSASDQQQPPQPPPKPPRPRPSKVRPKRPPPARPVAEGLTLLLTDQAGGRRMGYCRRVILNGAGLKHLHEKSVCLCVLTARPWPAFFRAILWRLTAALESSGWDEVEALAAAIRVAPIPEPGYALTVALPNPAKTLVLGKRPRDLLRPAVENPCELFQTLGSWGLVSVFVAALLERRVLVTGSSLEKVSRSVLAICGLLYPFKWQHICITMLIPQLLDYVYSPIPFILGVQKYHYEAVRAMLDDVVVVDLDTGIVTDTAVSGVQRAASPGLAAPAIIPASSPSARADADPTSYLHIVTFRQSLVTIPSRPCSEDEEERIGEDIGGRFCKFLAKMIGHYEKFFRREPFPMEGAGEKMRLFDTKTFLKFHGKSEKRFLECFVNSQMFEQFVQEKEEELTGKGFLQRTKFDEDINGEKRDIVNDGIHIYNAKLFRKVGFSELTPPPRPPKPKSLAGNK